MGFLKALCIAFSIYSKIPVPNFEWKEKEFKYNLIFFPWVGAVIGVLVIIWSYAAKTLSLGNFVFALIGTAIPLLVTGGFHLDGYMDTMDALCSHKTKEEKLAILKDPHAGAFSIMMLALDGLIYIAAFSVISFNIIPVFACSFFFARTLSGISVLVFPKAKQEGMLYKFSSSPKEKEKKTVLTLLILQSAACVFLMAAINLICGLLVIAAGLSAFLYYRYISIKEIGGITGDTAGYFVTVSETAMCAAAAVYTVVMTAL